MLANECAYILEVSQKGSFTRASESLHITQPALSVAVKRFENRMGFSVFDRSKFPLQLTPEGVICVQTLKDMVCLQNDMMQSLDALNSKKEGNILIASTGYYCAYLLPRILDNFKKKYPGYAVKLTEVDAKNIEQQIEAIQADICITAKKVSHEGYASHN